MIIGLSGFARSGKDTVASLLPQYSRRAFADKMREALWRMNPILRDQIRLQDALEELKDFESVKAAFPELRRLLQVFGTEVGRHMISEDLWIDLATRDLQAQDRVVFTDVRFPNEAAAIKALGGVIWRINRTAVTAVNDHSSELAMNSYSFDAVIENDSTLEALAEKVRDLLSSSQSL